MLCDADKGNYGKGMYKRVNGVWSGRFGQMGVDSGGGCGTVARKAEGKQKHRCGTEASKLDAEVNWRRFYAFILRHGGNNGDTRVCERTRDWGSRDRWKHPGSISGRRAEPLI